MRRNIGGTDRIIRAVIGAAVIAAGAWAGSWWGLVGLWPLFTAAVGFCGSYAMFGVSTRRK